MVIFHQSNSTKSSSKKTVKRELLNQKNKMTDTKPKREAIIEKKSEQNAKKHATKIEQIKKQMRSSQIITESAVAHLENELISLEDELLSFSSEENTKEFKKLNESIKTVSKKRIKRATPHLIQIIKTLKEKDQIGDTIILAYQALGQIGTEESINFLKEEVQEETDQFLLANSILALAEAGDKSQEQNIISYLNSSDVDLKQSAILSLGLIKSDSAVTSLIGSYQTSSESSKMLIIQSLAQINTDESIAFLKKVASETTGPLSDLIKYQIKKKG